MTRLSGAVVAAIAVSGWSAAAQPQVFRATVDVVVVDVSVRDGDEPVRGLTPADFELRDNRVLQTLADFSVETPPLDVTVLADASESLDLRFDRSDAKAVRSQLAADIQRVPSLLQPMDHVQLLKFSSGLSAASIDDAVSIDPAPERQHTALFDSLLAALMQPPSPDRRRLAIVITDGIDTSSVVSHRTRAAVLDRSNVVVHLITTAVSRSGEQFGPPPVVRFSAASFGSVRLTTTFPESNFETFAWVLRDIADRTGGRHFEMQPGENFLPPLQRAIDEFRTRYMLRYVPAGVTNTGWHTLTVSVKNSKFEVKHRPGYWR